MLSGGRSYLWVIWTLLASASCQRERLFPEGFVFGVGTSSYQIEGGWRADGKGQNIWDVFTHKYPERIIDRSTGDLAGDSYRLYKEDVRNLAYLGVDFYRFSISWARVLPKGRIDKPNKAGIDYYNNLINELLKSGIKPIVTMYHWDLPQALEQIGGWRNKSMAGYFVDYADLLFKSFGDRVETWITFNEPQQICLHGYGSGAFAPGVHSPGVGDYLCTHTLLVAHGRTFKHYKDKYRKQQNGKVGLTINVMWNEPATDSPEDIEAAELSLQFNIGLYAHAIYSDRGDYPAAVRETIAKRSAERGLRRSRLPAFTSEEVKLLRKSADFFGLNQYTTQLISAELGDLDVFEVPSFDDDLGVASFPDPSWPMTNTSWLYVVPWGIRETANWLRREYGDIPILVTENGVSTQPGRDDKPRISFIRSYLANLLDAVDDGVNIVGYTYWSLMDNMEWSSGYTERFGLFEVDFGSPQRTRTARASAAYYRGVVLTGSLNPTKRAMQVAASTRRRRIAT